MTLILDQLHIRELSLGERGMFADGHLQVDAQGLAAELRADHDCITGVRCHVARPGESTRIYCCKDVVQPSYKLGGARAGEGHRLLLENMAVVSCGPIVGFQEGIIDMSGPGAELSPFSHMLLLVLEVDVAADTSPHQHEAALRTAALVAAEFVVTPCLDAEPDASAELDWDVASPDPSLPRIAYVAMVLSQGLLHDTYVLGRDAKHGLPRVLDPGVIADMGVVSGNCVSACDKNTTYHHRNNPVLVELLAGHGSRWNFVGVVITNQPIRLADKEHSARRAVALVSELGAAGAIITKEGFGNPDSDFMMILRLLKEAGIACVGVTDEFAGSDGGSQSLADSTPEADAIVSTGNANARVALPPLAHSIGPVPDVDRLAGGHAGCLAEDGSLEVELQAIMGATNELGFGTLSAREV